MSQPASRFYEFGPFRIDAEKRVLLREGEAVPLVPKAFDMLLALVRHRGEVLEKDRLLDIVWPDSIVEEANLPQNISALRKALGESPSERRYILTVPGRGYRFAAEVKELDAELPDLIVEKQTTSRLIIEEQSDQETRGRASALQPAILSLRSRPGLMILLVVGLVAAALSGLYFGFLRKPDGARTGALRSIAVLPFKTLGGEGDMFLGVGIADTLITRLSNLKEIQVRPTSSVLRLSNEGRAPVEIGQRLGVDSVLEGSIRRDGDRIRVTVQLVRVQDGAPLWAGKYDEKFTDIFTVEDSISAQVAESLATQLTAAQRAALSKRYTDNVEAYNLYLQGQYYTYKRTPDGIRKGMGYLRQAIEMDPDYALAYTGLAQSYAILPITSDVTSREAFPLARDAADRALEIDNTLAEAHRALASILQWQWEWSETERACRRSIELKPNDPMTRFFYAHLLSLLGRHTEALAEIRRAMELDPLSAFMNTFAGQFLYHARRYDEAAEQLQKAIEMDSADWVAHLNLGKVYVQKKMYTEAIAEFQKAREFSSGNSETISATGYTLAVSGKKDQARKVLDELKELSKQKYVPPYNIAMIYLGLEEKDRVFESLEKGYEDRDVRMVFLKTDPRWDTYRIDPRFASLLERVGLAP